MIEQFFGFECSIHHETEPTSVSPPLKQTLELTSQPIQFCDLELYLANNHPTHHDPVSTGPYLVITRTGELATGAKITRQFRVETGQNNVPPFVVGQGPCLSTIDSILPLSDLGNMTGVTIEVSNGSTLTLTPITPSLNESPAHHLR